MIYWKPDSKKIVKNTRKQTETKQQILKSDN